MEISWFTVLAQVINFMVLVWLLKRLLYKPVLNAIAEREKKIAAAITAAGIKKAEAQKEQEIFAQKNEAFDRERTAKLISVQEEVTIEKQRLLLEARQAAETLQQRYESARRLEEQQVTETLTRKIGDEVFAIARKTLSDLATANLEEQMVTAFINKIKGLTDGGKLKFVDAFGRSDKTICVKGAFTLTAASQSGLEEAIRAITGPATNFYYQSAPQMINGIGLEVADYTLSWNIDAYLDDLEKNFTGLLAGKNKVNENTTPPA